MTMYVTDKETLTQDGVRAEGHHLRKKYCSSRKLKDRIPPSPFYETNVMPISKQTENIREKKLPISIVNTDAKILFLKKVLVN